MLVKRKSTSRFPIKKSEFCLIVSSAKANESFTVYSLLVKDFKVGTRNFASFLLGVLIFDKIGQKDRQLSMISL